MPKLRRSIAAVLLVLGPHGLAAADELVSFARDIRPILSEHCFACHGPDEQQRQAELRLDDAASAFAAGAIEPGRPAESQVWLRINSSDPDEMMPPPDAKKELTDGQRDLIRRWIESGAEYEQHWSFAAPVKPDLPPLAGGNPIDAFLLQRLEAEGLSFSHAADRRTLIRRVTLDLTGLPPTPEEVTAFVRDRSGTAYERVVDNLLERVTYGEQMARYWLDLARYADTHGLHLDNERSMWPYRDWVVRAFHENLSFDAFTRWQLAGDLLENPTRDQLLASGFNRCNVSTGEGGSINEEWIFRYAVDRTSTMAEVWMGLTAGCAVCHDHKFDPISTREYYSLFAFFHSAADPAMDGNRIDTPPVLRLYSEQDHRRIEALDDEQSAIERELAAEFDAIEYVDPASLDMPTIRQIEAARFEDGHPAAAQVESNGGPLDISVDPTYSFAAWKERNVGTNNAALPEGLRQLVRGTRPNEWSEQQAQSVYDFWFRNIYAGVSELLKDLKSRQAAIEAEKAKIDEVTPVTLVMADLSQPRESYVMRRGAYDQPGDKVSREVPVFLPPLPERPEDRDYNRLDLANWLVSGRHPLTARVAVNRFWQQFFGTGLVRTSADFGSQGDPPSHPQLLDWLAVHFVEHGWDVKRLVTLIVTSEAYRQSSQVTPELLVHDPANRLLGRAPRLRLDAEVLRDQALFVSGLLVDEVGGKPVKPYQPPNIWEPVGFGTSNTRYYQQGAGDSLYRRSLYTFLKRTAPPPFMSTFDAPNREQSCPHRARSNTPMQALQLMNDIQHVEAARHFAARMLTAGSQESKGQESRARIQWAWTVVTGREPNEFELRVAAETLSRHRERYENDVAAAQELIGYGDSDPNEDLDASELAAYTMLANLLLNLDEVVTKN